MIKPVIIIARYLLHLYYSYFVYCFQLTCVMENGDLDITFIWKVFSGLFDLLLRSYGNFSLIVLNFYSETYRVPAIYSKIEGTYLPTMGAYKKKLGDLGNEELRQRTIENRVQILLKSI